MNRWSVPVKAVDIAEALDRIEIDNLPVERTRMHARRIPRRKVATLTRLREPRRTVEIGRWLRLQLLELTDTVLEQTSPRIGQLWAEAHRAVEARALHEVERNRFGISVISSALDDRDLTPEALRAAIVSAISPLRDTPASPRKLHAIRTELASAPGKLRVMLQQVGALDSPSMLATRLGEHWRPCEKSMTKSAWA